MLNQGCSWKLSSVWEGWEELVVQISTSAQHLISQLLLWGLCSFPSVANIKCVFNSVWVFIWQMVVFVYFTVTTFSWQAFFDQFAESLLYSLSVSYTSSAKLPPPTRILLFFLPAHSGSRARQTVGGSSSHHGSSALLLTLRCAVLDRSGSACTGQQKR